MVHKDHKLVNAMDRWVSQITGSQLRPPTEIGKEFGLVICFSGDFDRWTEHAVSPQGLLRHRSYACDHSLKLLWVERLVLSGCAGEIPGMCKHVPGNDHVDGLS